MATLNVTGFPAGSQITNVSANINLNHTWGGDMQIILENPNAINFVEFVNDPTDSQLQFGSSGGTVSQTYSFTSTGSTMTILANPNTANPVPFPGPYKPVDGSGVVTTFATFNTLNPNGIWKLYVGDGVSGDGGTVSLLSLTITANSATAIITHTPVNTNDGNACTSDGCNSATGIFHTPVSTDDGNACTTDACNTSTGTITHTAVNVDDGNACTTDACNSSTGTITHTAVNVDDGNACTIDACNTQNGVITHTPTGCSGVTFTSRIFLEGFYIGGGFMNNLLYMYNQSLPVPNPSITSDMSDSITISAMDDIPFSHALVDSKIGILKTNGDVSVNFGPSVIANSNYYIKINHRNHVEIWSAAPLLLNTSTTYNFLSSQSQAYGNNQALTFDAAYAAMFTGDINQDGAVDGTDFLDFDGPNQVGAGGYELADLNGDGGVDGSDFLVYDPNSQNGVGVLVPIP